MEKSFYTGKGIGVCILDTGIYEHIDFTGRIWTFYDFLDFKRRPYDDNGHGTHVAGLVAGDGTASMGKYRGAAPGCGIISLKVLDRYGTGSQDDVLRALRWIRENRQQYRIRVVNISVGTTCNSKRNHARLLESVEQLWDEGVVVVTAAGNQGPRPGSITAPGSSKKIITVGSSDMITSAFPISGRGPTRECICKPDVVAPGQSIMSCAPRPGRYVAKSGTSMSTPRISGGIALLLEKYPELTNVQIKERLLRTAKDLGLPRNQQGHGLFQLQRFLN